MSADFIVLCQQLLTLKSRFVTFSDRFLRFEEL